MRGRIAWGIKVFRNNRKRERFCKITCRSGGGEGIKTKLRKESSGNLPIIPNKFALKDI